MRQVGEDDITTLLQEYLLMLAGEEAGEEPPAFLTLTETDLTTLTLTTPTVNLMVENSIKERKVGPTQRASQFLTLLAFLMP